MYLIDTNILIDYLRENAAAVRFLEGLKRPALVSALTVAELYAGVREGQERQRMEAFLRAFTVMPVTETLAQNGGLYRQEYGATHGTDLVDGIIAATAKVNTARLVTLNRKHFPMLSRVLVPYGQTQ